MNINIRQIEFKSTNGSDTVLGWLYTPAEMIRGVVQLSHGMAEHMGRYHDFMRYLAQNGYAAAGIDQIGHGRSAKNEQYGFFSNEDGWKILIDDQYKFNKIIRSEVPGARCALLGHSMGSLVARLYAAKYPQSISGLIISGTARGGLRVEVAIQAANRSAKKFGSGHTDRGLYRMAFGGYNDRFEPNRTAYDWLSRDAEAVQHYVDDPKCGFVLTAAAYRDLFILTRNANGKRCLEATKQDMPVLLISGTMDPVGEYGRGPREVYSRFIKAGMTDVEMVLYEGGRHEMLNEVNRTQVYECIREWLDVRLPQEQRTPVAIREIETPDGPEIVGGGYN